jgi:hypothetical protein
MIRTSQLTDEQFAELVAKWPVSGGKGDSSASNTEKGQAGFATTLQSIFANNNAQQQNQLNFLNQKLQAAIANPQGFTPQALAAMRTQATEAGASQNQQVEQAVNNKFATEGGATSLPSGVQAQIQAQTANQAEQNVNNAQLGITEANANLQNQNEWNAIKGEEDVAGIENPEGIAGAENSAAGTVSNLSEANTQANGPGIGSILGGVVGAGLSGWAGGGFKTHG